MTGNDQLRLVENDYLQASNRKRFVRLIDGCNPRRKGATPIERPIQSATKSCTLDSNAAPHDCSPPAGSEIAPTEPRAPDGRSMDGLDDELAQRCRRSSSANTSDRRCSAHTIIRAPRPVDARWGHASDLDASATSSATLPVEAAHPILRRASVARYFEEATSSRPPPWYAAGTDTNCSASRRTASASPSLSASGSGRWPAGAAWNRSAYAPHRIVGWAGMCGAASELASTRGRGMLTGCVSRRVHASQR